MITESHAEFVRTTGSKFGRFLMGLFFFTSGLSMLFIMGPANVAGFFTSLGIPLAGIVAWLVIVFKIAAGGCLMVGRYVAHASAALIAFTLIATVLAHLDFSDPDQMGAAMKNIAIVGGLLYMMAFGPGGINILSSEKK